MDKMKQVFKRPESLTKAPFHFCPGCHHGIIHRLVAEALDHFDLKEKAIGVASVGCSVFLYNYFDVDVIEAPHGRAPAVATGIKKARKENFVFAYQGDGDMAAIGTSEIIHTANRGIPVTVIFVNNAIYGMTGGQMAPTTLLGQHTSTTPYGRDFRSDGYPIKMAELLGGLEGTAFSARVAVDKPANLRNARKQIRRACEMQLKGMGFSMVEVLSACPTDWGLSPQDALKRIDEEMIPYYPLGIYKEKKTPDYL